MYIGKKTRWWKHESKESYTSYTPEKQEDRRLIMIKEGMDGYSIRYFEDLNDRVNNKDPIILGKIHFEFNLSHFDRFHPSHEKARRLAMEKVEKMIEEDTIQEAIALVSIRGNQKQTKGFFILGNQGMGMGSYKGMQWKQR
jgi:hypothetical protein